MTLLMLNGVIGYECSGCGRLAAASVHPANGRVLGPPSDWQTVTITGAPGVSRVVCPQCLAAVLLVLEPTKPG